MSSPNSNPSSSRKGKGRKKVNITKIENESNLNVTFSKRRAGVFKKASEISTLCGAEAAVVVYSPANKAHSFGHPNLNTVANKFLNQIDNDINNVPPSTPPAMSDADKYLEAHLKAKARQQAAELSRLERELEAEKRRTIELRRQKAMFDINQLNYDQLSRLKGFVLGFQQQFEAKVMREVMGVPEAFEAPSVFRFDHGGPSRVAQPNQGGPSSGPEPDNVTNLMVGDVVEVPMIPYSSTASSSTVNPNQQP